jgi:hypothetical protein
MRGQLVEHLLGRRERPVRVRRFSSAFDDLPLDLVEGGLDGDRPAEEVDGADPQPEHLGLAEPQCTE